MRNKFQPNIHQLKIRWIGKIIFVLLILLPLLAGCSPEPGSAGAPGSGDTYFPGLGNGGYDVSDYLLALDVDPPSNQVRGSVTIDATTATALSDFNLDFQGMTVDSIQVNSKPANYSRNGNELSIHPARTLADGRKFSVKVEYHGSPQAAEAITSAQSVREVGWFHSSEGTINVMAEPNGAETWFPVNDHPLDKATYRFEITVPEPWVVAASGSLQKTEDLGDRTRYIWEMDHPMASYLASINIGQYNLDQSELPGGIILRNYLPAGFPDDEKEPLKFLPEMIDYFSSLFGPYPFKEYGIVVAAGDITPCSRSIGGALETQSLTVSCPNSYVLSENGIAHELAHQWFGDSVSLKNWQDIWMKEGMATYAEWLWATRRLDASQLDTLVQREMQRYIIPADIGAPPADDLYDDPAYAGGALVYHALRRQVGDDTFFKIIQTYTERYRFGNASAADFIALSEEISGQDLSAFFDSWLKGKDMPEIAPAAP